MSERRGRKPGGPKTGGRKAGTLNKATREIKELAMQFSERNTATRGDVTVR
jgi:hypothetical protein